MTRKDYEALAAAFARTRPTEEQYTTRTPATMVAQYGDNSMFDGISYKAAYGAWEATIRAVCDELEEANPAFDRQRFQFAATTDTVRGNDGRATIWLVDYRFNGMTRDEALQAAGAAAIRDVPDAEIKYMSDRSTPKGTWVITLKRTRKAVEA